MPIASGASHGLTYIQEVTYGVTPATPAMKALRNTGVTVGLKRDSIQSEELRSDRQIVGFRLGNKQVNGSVDIELAYGDFDDMLQAALCGTWATNVLKAGSVRRSFTLERFFTDIPTRLRYTGCEVNELNLTVAPNSQVKGSISFIGKDQDSSNAMITGATYPAPTNTQVFDSFIGTIKEGGVTYGSCTQIELSIKNGIEPNFVIGSSTTAGNTIGQSVVTGTVTAFFENVTMLNKFINETDSSLEFELVDLANNRLKFFLPKIKYTGGQPDVTGPGSISLSLPFQALYNTADLSQIVITRTPQV